MATSSRLPSALPAHFKPSLIGLIWPQELEGELDFYRSFVAFLADFMASAAARLKVGL